MKSALGKKNLFKVVLIVGAFIGFWNPQRLLSQGPIHNNAPSSEWRPTDGPSAGAHFKFTDHHIRVIRPNDRVPL